MLTENGYNLFFIFLMSYRIKGRYDAKNLFLH
jgi:hypothetical protein